LLLLPTSKIQVPPFCGEDVEAFRVSIGIWKSRRSVVISSQTTFVLRLDPSVPANMLALIFMSVGGSLPFIGRGVLSRSRLLPSIVLTIIGSGLGVLLLLSIPLKALRITIPVAMIGVAVFSLLNKNLGRASQDCEHVA
jgi:uncharacterized membrane protein YfcA